MTYTLDPHRHRPTDRGPQPTRHTGPYYGHSLRRVLAPEVTDPSWIERITDWYAELTNGEVAFVTLVVILAMFCAAAIVLL